MNPVLKLALYVVLAVTALLCGTRFFAAYSERMARAERRFDAIEAALSAATNSATAAEGQTDTNAAASTNLTSTNALKATKPAKGAEPVKPAATPRLGLYGFGFLIGVVGLALLLANDVSHYLATRTHKALYNEEGEGVVDPDYEQAEETWANGDHLEAIRLMRDYLKRNPREQHAALRIAEIYEKDLNNPLAAALEYEEVLTKKLPDESWGWAAIHLCNLYYRLNKPDQATALLRRIDEEFSHTAAAEKARKRLALIESGEIDLEEPPRAG
jgi:TolA-binding protein